MEKWKKSSRCDNAACLEVAEDGDIAVRNNQEPTRTLTFSRRSWQEFLDGVKGDAIRK